MYYLHNQPWSTPESVEIDGEVQWNLWRIRQPPYLQLEVGHRVLLCCPTPAGSRITYEVEVHQVEKAPYATKREAWATVEAAFGLGWSFSKFRDAPYAVERPDRGHLLAFSYDVVQELQVPRPPEWKLRPNGWLMLTDDQAMQVLG